MTHPHTMDRKMNALVRALAKEGVPFDIYANRWENETYFNICIPSMDNNKIDVGFAPSTYGYERGEFELLVEDAFSTDFSKRLKASVDVARNVGVSDDEILIGVQMIDEFFN